MNFNEVKLDEDFVKDSLEARVYNESVIKYYNRFINESSVLYSKETLINLRNNISNCNKIWILDYYKNLNIKKIHRIHLCKNKFCSNCKKVAQASRMAKYIPVLEPHSKHLYHFILTVPNCDGNNLRLTIKHMSKCFKTLIRYISGLKKIRGLDFSNWGYLGCVRSLEITFNGDSYHPHFHCAFSLEHMNFDESNKTNINTFSYDNRNGIKKLNRLFSTEEILIQKIWYLLINKITVNLKNISALDLGYSCCINKFAESDYAELFKYLTKITDEKGSVMQYNNFVAINYGTYRIKQIQGYGCFFNITDDGDVDSYVEQYNELIDYLNKNDNPVRTFEFLSKSDKDKELLKLSNDFIDNFNKKYGVVDTKNSTYINLKKFIQYLKQL